MYRSLIFFLLRFSYPFSQYPLVGDGSGGLQKFRALPKPGSVNFIYKSRVIRGLIDCAQGSLPKLIKKEVGRAGSEDLDNAPPSKDYSEWRDFLLARNLYL